MSRQLATLFALFALLCAAPLHAQDDNPLVGSWVGVEMDGEPMPEGEFNITFNDDGTGTFSERGFDGDAFTYTFGEDGENICTVLMEGKEAFSFAVAVDGDTAMFTPTDEDGPPPLKLRRVAEDGDAEDAEDNDVPAGNALVGTWMGESFDGEPIDEGDFVLTFNADGSGSIIEGGDDAEPFEYTYDADAQRCVIFFGEEREEFPIDVVFDGDTATFTPTGDDDVLVARRVGADADDAEAPAEAPEPADLSDSPLVGRWELVSFNGEPMPEDQRYVFHNHADGTGTSTVNGEPGDGYTWQHDFETGVATFTHPDQEPAAFTFEIEDGVATYVSTDGTMTIVERRVAGDAEGAMAEDADDVPAGVPAPEPEPVDMSGSPLVGLWMLVKFNGQDVPENLVVYEHRPDGTGTVIEEGERGEEFRWEHDVEDGSIVVHDAEGIRYEFTLVMQDDLVFYVSTDETMRIVHRRVGDLEAAADEYALVGTWVGLRMGDRDLDPGDFALTFNADGTGELDDGGDENEPFTYSYDADAELYTIQVEEEEPIVFSAAFEGDEVTLTPVGEDAPPVLVMRRVAEDNADDADDNAGAMDEDGVIGTWYVQQMRGEWLPVGEEFRLEFRDDGTAHAFENGEPEDDVMNYAVDEDRGVIVITEARPGGEVIDIHYEHFDDVLILTFRDPDGFGAEEEEILLCRRPEGNEEHQRERAAQGGRGAVPNGAEGAGRAVEDAVEDAAEAVEDAVEEFAE
ncbi:MAG: hypothetical protein AAGA29_07535 [Planctomycetota bacterium]